MFAADYVRQCLRRTLIAVVRLGEQILANTGEQMFAANTCSTEIGGLVHLFVAGSPQTRLNSPDVRTNIGGFAEISLANSLRVRVGSPCVRGEQLFAADSAKILLNSLVKSHSISGGGR